MKSGVFLNHSHFTLQNSDLPIRNSKTADVSVRIFDNATLTEIVLFDTMFRGTLLILLPSILVAQIIII